MHNLTIAWKIKEIGAIKQKTGFFLHTLYIIIKSRRRYYILQSYIHIIIYTWFRQQGKKVMHNFFLQKHLFFFVFWLILKWQMWHEFLESSKTKFDEKNFPQWNFTLLTKRRFSINSCSVLLNTILKKKMLANCMNTNFAQKCK